MADIQYLNYGDLQIELLAFLNKAANEVQAYVQNQPWSRKRKEKFMSAYSDLMNRGVLGASNSSGQWVLDIGGDDLELDSKDTKDKEMYQEAAYFILQQMAGMPTRSAQAEKEKKDLPVFDNKYFTEALHTKIGKDEFGGKDWDTQNDWNGLDTRGENGLRGKSKRAETLSRHLQEYANSLEEGKLNFEGSPFADLNDFRTRVGNAVEALKNPDNEEGITTALNRLGLTASDYFNNGSGDLSNTINPATNQPFTYAELALYNQQQAELKRKLLLEALEQARKNAYNNTLILSRGSSKLQGRSAQELKTKYGTDDNLRQALFQYSQLDIRRLTPDEQSEIHGAYRYLAKDPIDKKLLKKLQLSSSGLYKNAAPNRFRKINGIDNLIWDSAAGQVLQIQTINLYNANKNQSLDLFKGVKTSEEKNKEYLGNTEFTEADKYELAGIVADIASIVDPEPISAGTIGVVGAGLRNYARTRGPEKWGASDYFWQGVDYLSGVIGAVPGLGDAALVYKAVKNSARFLKYALRIPAVYELASSTPGALDAANKVLRGENPTVEEWMTLGSFFRGLAANRNLNVQNRAQRRALLKRGYEVGNKWHLKLGITESKPLNSQNIPTVKVNVEGKPTLIPINKELKTKLDKELSKAENSAEARSNIIRNNKEVLEAAKKAGIEVKDWSKVTVPYNESLFNMRLFKNKVGLFPKYLRNSGDIYGSTNIETPKNADTFDEYLKGDRGIWDRIKYGSNRTLRGMDRINGGKSEQTLNNNKETQQKSSETESPKTLTPEEIKVKREATKNYREFLTGTKDPIKEGTVKVGDSELKVSKSSVKKKGEETFDIHFGKIHKYNITQLEAKLRIKELVKQYRKTTDSNGKVVSKKSTEEIGKILKDLKKKGWFKQGGNLNL